MSMHRARTRSPHVRSPPSRRVAAAGLAGSDPDDSMSASRLSPSSRFRGELAVEDWGIADEGLARVVDESGEDVALSPKRISWSTVSGVDMRDLVHGEGDWMNVSSAVRSTLAALVAGQQQTQSELAHVRGEAESRRTLLQQLSSKLDTMLDDATAAAKEAVTLRQRVDVLEDRAAAVEPSVNHDADDIVRQNELQYTVESIAHACSSLEAQIESLRSSITSCEVRCQNAHHGQAANAKNIARTAGEVAALQRDLDAAQSVQARDSEARVSFSEKIHGRLDTMVSRMHDVASAVQDRATSEELRDVEGSCKRAIQHKLDADQFQKVLMEMWARIKSLENQCGDVVVAEQLRKDGARGLEDEKQRLLRQVVAEVREFACKTKKLHRHVERTDDRVQSMKEWQTAHVAASGLVSRRLDDLVERMDTYIASRPGKGRDCSCEVIAADVNSLRQKVVSMSESAARSPHDLQRQLATTTDKVHHLEAVACKLERQIGSLASSVAAWIRADREKRLGDTY